MNLGVDAARGDFVAIMIDGARMLSPGIVVNFLRARRLFPNAFVATLGWHLGDEPQNISMLNGYDQSCEDDLLESFDWREDGYQLLPTHRLHSRPPEVGFQILMKVIVLHFQGKCSWPSAALMKASPLRVVGW